MKRYFLVALFCLVILSAYNVSADYHGTFTMSVGDSVSVNIGNPPSFNVTNGSGVITTPATPPSGGTGGGVTSLSSVVTGVDENQTTGTPAGTSGTSEETNLSKPIETSSTGFLGLTGAAIGNFVKSGEGIATFLVLITVVVGAIALSIVKKKKLLNKKDSEVKE